jgi:hypothetical protein
MIYFAYNIPPPTNITNMFENHINGADKIYKAQIRIGVLLYVSLSGMLEMIISLTTQCHSLFAGYSLGCSLDSTLVLPSSDGSTGLYGY